MNDIALFETGFAYPSGRKIKNKTYVFNIDDTGKKLIH